LVRSRETNSVTLQRNLRSTGSHAAVEASLLRGVAIFVLLVVGELPAKAAALKGVVLANELSGPPLENVGVDAISGTNRTASDSSGKFTLQFPQRRAGDLVRIIVEKAGYVVVNDVQLQLAIPADTDAVPLTVILAKEVDREEMARRFYRLKSFEAIEETYKKRVKELEEAHQADSLSLEKLRQERDQANAAAEKAAEELAKNQPGKGSELYQDAMRLFLDGKIQEAIELLDDEALRKTIAQAEQTKAQAEETIAQAEQKIADVVQGWLLKARLFGLQFRFKEALKAYKSALGHIKREKDPQLWAATKVEVGFTHAEVGIRTAGRAAKDHLVSAVISFRSALEIYTREDLPQQWAMTQNNLGNALQKQGIRSGGEQGRELLAQAVQAYRSALEIYTREDLPQDWAMTQHNLGEALSQQGIRTGGEQGRELLAQAVQAYRSALEIRTREDLPQQWAMTQNNLGEALQKQGIRSGGEQGRELLARAVEAYRSALEIYTREDLPQQWAMTENNLATALGALGDLLEGDEGLKRKREAVELLREIESYQLDDDSRWNLAINLGALAFKLILNRQFAEAQARCEEAQKFANEIGEGIEKTDLENLIFIQQNLAHALLFQGRYDEALTIYRQNWDKPQEGKTFAEITLEDFVAFDKAGLTHPDLSRMKRELGELHPKVSSP
jgi:tetratricopeptide (TPR) repeat protein